jgi:CHAD domain-containing protein
MLTTSMSFALTSKSSLTESLVRVLASEIDALVGTSRNESGIDERVHETRKSIKRLRALLRLYRGALPHTLYEQEDAVLRRLGQTLGRARDAVALRESLGLLVQSAPGDVRARLADHLTALQGAIENASSTNTTDVDAALDAVHDALGAVRARAGDWTVEQRGFSTIAPGLRRTYARGRQGLARARHRPSEKRLHELRIWVKRHQYQLTLLEPLWPEPINAFRHEAQRLGELLGHDHDLSLLERRFDVLGDHPDLALLETPLRIAAENSHAAFQREAFDLGARIYAESPGRFTARYREYFDAWP